MAVQQWLGDSFCAFVSTVTQLGNAAKSFEFGRFQTILRELGMQDDEIIRLWNGIDGKRTSCGSWKGGDRDIAAQCGILLDSTLFPGNFLLYRLLSLVQPNILLSVSVETIPSKRNIKPGRWEFAGEGKQNVLNLKFPATKKKSRNRSFRYRYYARPYMLD